MKKSAFALTLTALLSGCAGVVEQALPGTSVPAAWREPPTGKESLSSMEWWRTFGSPRLDGLMAKALAGNFDLAAATSRVRQADAAMRIAGAALLPVVDAAASADRQRSPALPGIQTVKQGNVLSPVITASYDLDFWGRNQAAVTAAEASAESLRFDRVTVTLDVEAAVATAYFDSLGLADRLAIARENLSEAENLAEAFRGRMTMGAATRLDVAQQETQVAVVRAGIPPLERQLRQALDALAVLTGSMPEEMPDQPGSLRDLPLPEIGPGLPSTLLARRPDVQSAEAALTSANANIAVARAAFFPTISLTAQGGLASNALSGLFQPGSSLFTLASSLAQPIFEGGRLEANVELQQARYDELVQRYRKTVALAFADVENSLAAVRKTNEERLAQLAAMNTAQEAFDIAQAQMAGGTADIFAVLNTQRTLYTARDAVARATLDALSAEVSLFKAIGGGWDAHHPE